MYKCTECSAYALGLFAWNGLFWEPIGLLILKIVLFRGGFFCGRGRVRLVREYFHFWFSKLVRIYADQGEFC